jgi:hypothetical protein
MRYKIEKQTRRGGNRQMSERIRFEFTAGCGLLSSAGTSNPDIRHTLDGDLEQMWTQERFLLEQGMKPERNDVYPGFRTKEEYERAIRLIWENRVMGWWRYEKDLVAAGICTQAEFDARLLKK